MSDKDESSAQPQNGISSLDVKERSKLRDRVFGNLVEKLNPWLLEFGNWMFGGLIAFNLVIVAALLTVGPVDLAVVVSIMAFACALPLNVSGLFALKLIKDMNDLAIDDVIKQAFEEADIPDVESRFPASEENESPYRKRTNVGLSYAVKLAGLSVILTLLGMVAALTYIAWWVAAIFIAVVIISLAVTMNVVARLISPQSETLQERRLRYQEQIAKSKNK